MHLLYYNCPKATKGRTKENFRPVAPFGPDRYASRVEVPRVPFEKLRSQRTGEPSEKVRERVEVTRTIRRERFKGTDLSINTDMRSGEIR